MKLYKIHFAFICLILTGLSTANLVHADSTAANKNNPASNITNKHKSPNLKQSTVTAVNSHKRKEILVDNKSRSLSAFFMLGIIINIIMVTIFGWWFTKEWRSQKK